MTDEKRRSLYWQYAVYSSETSPRRDDLDISNIEYVRRLFEVVQTTISPVL